MYYYHHRHGHHFRVWFRGKDSGHDIDLVISHPVEGEERGVLPALVARLERAGRVVHGRLERASHAPPEGEEGGEHVRGTPLKNGLDGFEKWIGVLRTDKKWRLGGGGDGSCSNSEKEIGLSAGGETRLMSRNDAMTSTSTASENNCKDTASQNYCKNTASQNNFQDTASQNNCKDMSELSTTIEIGRAHV